MIPSSYVLVDDLPKNSSGKVDRRPLPEPDLARGREEINGPATEAEEAIASIWREVLGVDEIDREDDFFALGGHSLRAVRILTRINEEFGVQLPMRLLFEETTLARLASAVEDAIMQELDALSDAEVTAALDQEEGM